MKNLEFIQLELESTLGCYVCIKDDSLVIDAPFGELTYKPMYSGEKYTMQEVYYCLKKYGAKMNRHYHDLWLKEHENNIKE